MEMERFVRPQMRFLASCNSLNGCMGDDIFALSLAQEIIKVEGGENILPLMLNPEQEFRPVYTFIMEAPTLILNPNHLPQPPTLNP